MPYFEKEVVPRALCPETIRQNSGENIKEDPLDQQQERRLTFSFPRRSLASERSGAIVTVIGPDGIDCRGRVTPLDGDHALVQSTRASAAFSY